MVPFKGFRSRSQYVVDRYTNGKSMAEIKAESKMSYQQISAIISYHFTTSDNLKLAATKRAMTVPELKQKLMFVIERDNLIDAILDDSEGADATSKT